MHTLDTKERLLDAAEGIFAEHGFAAASMRSIAKGAQVNLAAAHYHFGSKRGLFRAVFERRISAIHQERIERLQALEAVHGKKLPLTGVLEALLAPALLRLGTAEEGWTRFTKLLGRSFVETGDPLEALIDVVRPSRDRFVSALQASAPHLSLTDVHWRLHLLIGSLCMLLANPERVVQASEGLCPALDRALVLRELLTFAEGAFRAPPAPPPAESSATKRPR